MEVKVEKIKDRYFFTTEEKVMKCTKCKSEYKSRKVCLKCFKERKEKVKTWIEIKERVGHLTEDLSKFNCSCIWGSWFRWSVFWKENHPSSRCRHITQAIRLIKNEKNNNK